MILSSICKYLGRLQRIIDVEQILRGRHYVVTGNRSKTSPGESNSKVSLCCTSKLDLVAFNPSQSVLLYIQEIDEVEQMDLSNEDFIAQDDGKELKLWKGY